MTRKGLGETEQVTGVLANGAKNLEESEYSATAEMAKVRGSAEVWKGEASELWMAKIAIVTDF